MKKKVILTVILVLVFTASVAGLVLYNIGDMIIDSAIDSALSVTDAAPELSPTEASSPDVAITQPVDQTPDAESVPTNAAAETATTPTAATSSPSAPTPEPKQYTTSEIQDIKNSVTVEDKLSISAMVLNKLSQDDINYLTSLLSGGLTAEEKAAAKAICFARFDSEEIGKIYDYYKAYTAEG